jgi:hypothetical protein
MALIGAQMDAVWKRVNSMPRSTSAWMLGVRMSLPLAARSA